MIPNLSCEIDIVYHVGHGPHDEDTRPRVMKCTVTGVGEHAGQTITFEASCDNLNPEFVQRVAHGLAGHSLLLRSVWEAYHRGMKRINSDDENSPSEMDELSNVVSTLEFIYGDDPERVAEDELWRALGAKIRPKHQRKLG